MPHIQTNFGTWREQRFHSSTFPFQDFAMHPQQHQCLTTHNKHLNIPPMWAYRDWFIAMIPYKSHKSTTYQNPMNICKTSKKITMIFHPTLVSPPFLTAPCISSCAVECPKHRQQSSMSWGAAMNESGPWTAIGTAKEVHPFKRQVILLNPGKRSKRIVFCSKQNRVSSTKILSLFIRICLQMVDAPRRF